MQAPRDTSYIYKPQVTYYGLNVAVYPGKKYAFLIEGNDFDWMRITRKQNNNNDSC